MVKPDIYQIPHSRPTLGRKEAEQVRKVVESGQIGQGPKVRQFESEFARKMGMKYSVAVSSGTAALHLTLLALKIGAGDEVVIPSFVCSALLNAVHYVGATAIFAEINPETYNLDPDDTRKRLTKNTKAVIVPHLFGLPADMNDFINLDVPIIEDCAQAVGAIYRSKPVGTMGVAGVYSFYATKVMTTGEGGMIVSHSKQLIERIADLREYDQKTNYHTRYNYKMTDMQAALGLVQLDRLDSFVAKRRSVAGRYNRAFGKLGLGLPRRDSSHIYYRYVIEAKTDSTPWIKKLRVSGIGSGKPVFQPLHLHFRSPGFLKTETAWQNTLSLPIYPSLSDEDITKIIRCVSGSQP